MMKPFFQLTFVLLFWSLLVVPAKGQDLYFEQITGTELSPNTPIHGITKDSIGFIWVSTWNGVYRYDGNEFDLYKHEKDNANSLPSNRIRNIIRDQKNSIWLLSYDKEYVKYNYNYDHFEVIPDSMVPMAVISLLNSTSNFINKKSFINNHRYYLSSHILTELDLSTNKEVQYLPDFQQMGKLQDDYVTCFYIDDQQIIWVGTRRGDIYKANSNRKPFTLHSCTIEDNGRLKRVSPRAILKTTHELIIGTNNNGLISNETKGYYPINKSLKIISDQLQIRSFYMESDKSIWIGSTQGIDVYQQNQENSFKVINEVKYPELEAHSVYSIERLSSTKLIAGLYNGWAIIDVYTGKVDTINLNNLIGSRSVMKILVDHNSQVWMATEGKGVIRVKLSPDGSVIDSLVINANGTEHKSITGNIVYALYEDYLGNIWVGTSQGLNRIDANTMNVKQFTMANGLSDNYISSIVGDDQGTIWLSHKNGISRIEIDSFKISNYSIKDNFQKWTFLDGACYKDTINNYIYFGAREGYVQFKPSEIKSNPYRPKLVMKKFNASNVSLAPGELVGKKALLKKKNESSGSINLNYNNNDLAIELAVLHYEDPFNNKIQYKLEGYNNEWIQTSQHVINFTKLPAGKYIFRAKALSPDELISNELRLFIHIFPPWYASPYAIIIYFVLVTTILFFFYREILLRERLKSEVKIEHLKIEQQNEVTREKLDFFTNVSHELRTPLSLVSDPVKQLQKENLSIEKRRTYLSLISKNIGYLTELINQLLDFRKIDAGKLDVKDSKFDQIAVIRNVVNDFTIRAEEREITLLFHPEIASVYGYFDREKLKQIVNNILANAFKYTNDGGQIKIDVNFYNEKLNIKISDNGIGIKPESLEMIFEPFNNEGTQPYYGNSSGLGLAYTKKLVELLKGNIEVESESGRGTKVSLIFPFEILERDKIKEVKYALPSVLIVEDNPDLQNYLATSLSDEYAITQEYNGKNGLSTSIDIIPDVIVSDVMMPEMDGNEMCYMLKRNEKTCHIPIIMLTAKTADQHKVESLQTGVDVYLTKPFNVDVLRAQIKSCIDNRKRIESQLAKTPSIEALQNTTEGIDNKYLNRIIEIVNQNISDTGFSQEQLAEKLQISHRQLQRKIKALSGNTAHEFITRIRMEEAIRLLLETSLNVSQISYEIGYTEPSNFSRTFTKHFGCSPTKYIQQNKNS